MNPIEYIRDFRHTYQHLDERVDEAFIEFNIPIYGILTWNYSNLKTKKLEVIITSSGITRYKSQYSYDVANFNKNNLNQK